MDSRVARRHFLKLLTLGVAGLELDVDRLLWVQGKKKIFLPTTNQVSLFGIPYHQTNAATGTWLGITRSTEPWNYKRILDEVCIRVQE